MKIDSSHVADDALTTKHPFLIQEIRAETSLVVEQKGIVYFYHLFIYLVIF